MLFDTQHNELIDLDCPLYSCNVFSLITERRLESKMLTEKGWIQMQKKRDRSRRERGQVELAVMEWREKERGREQVRWKAIEAISNTINTVQSLHRMISGGIFVFWGQMEHTIHLTFISNLLHNVFALADGVCIHVRTHTGLTTWVWNYNNPPNEGLIEYPGSYGNKTD